MLTGATIIKQTLEWSRAKSRRLRDEWTGFDGLALKLVENEVVKVGTRGSSNISYYYFIYLFTFLCLFFFFFFSPPRPSPSITPQTFSGACR